MAVRETGEKTMRLVRLLLAAFAALILSLAPVMAEEMSTRVIVPDAPGGAIFSGCYRVQQNLYGPYRMTFCLEQRGTYSVRGGGVRCDGRLDWSAKGRDINVKLRRTSCGNGVAWSADTMTCRGGALLPAFLAKIIVPDLPVLQTLRCTYDPQPKGEKSKDITARRID
jgi:hypothetical protein